MKPGEVIGQRFEIAHQAGAGGMGVVYRARDLRSGAPVAIKVLVGHRVVQHARFAREAEVLAGLDHPAVVRYVAHGATPEGEAFLAMEWLEGESLSARLAAARLSLQETVTLASRVAGALATAHRAGVVHRDVKPSNVMLVGRDVSRATLVDFGVARVIDRTLLTATGGMIGTVGYMAPEQARGDNAIDARADVFALGAVIFRCLAGHPPFEGGEPLTLLVRLINEDAPRLSSVLDGVPPPVDDLLARMLSRDLAQRPQDGQAAAFALGRLGPVAPGPALRQKAQPASETPPVWSTAPLSVSKSASPPPLSSTTPPLRATGAPPPPSMTGAPPPPSMTGVPPPSTHAPPPSTHAPPPSTHAPPPPSSAGAGLPISAPVRSRKPLLFALGAAVIALGAALLGASVLPGQRAWGACYWERCERLDLPNPADVAQLVPKLRAAVLAVDRSAVLVSFVSAGPVKNGLVDTNRGMPAAFFRVPAGQPSRNTIMATVIKGRIEMRWMEAGYEPRNLPDPHCSGAKLAAAARAHGVWSEGGVHFAYVWLPGGPGWSVSVTAPKPAVILLNDRGCEPF